MNRDIRYEENNDYSVDISETTWKVLEAYNALKVMNIEKDIPELNDKIGDALDKMHEVLRELLAQDLLIG